MEQTKMTINEFVKQFTCAPNDTAKAKLCNDVIKRRYVPIMEKFAALSGIASKCETKVGAYGVHNSFLGYLSYVMLTIELYTTLSLDEGMDIDGGYDALKENKALDAILLCIGQDELDELQRVNKMILTDLRDAEQSPEIFVNNQIAKISGAIKEALDYLKSLDHETLTQLLANIGISTESVKS